MYRIVRKEALRPTVTLYEIEAPLIAKKAQPGQFIILRTDENGERIPLSRGSVTDGVNTTEIYATTPLQAEMLREVIASATKMMDYDTSIINIVKEEAAAYFAGQKSAEEVTNLIQSKANIYINEQK